MIEEIKRTVEALRNGKVILYPTDTIWGIGCDASNAQAVDKIFEIKSRPTEKSMIVLLDDAIQLNKYIQEIPAIAWDLIEVADKPLTIVYSGAKNLPSNVINPDGSIAIRIVADPFCKQLIHRLGKPIISTSANLSGEMTPSNYSEISENIISSVDYVVQHRRDDKSIKKPSSIIRLNHDGEIKIIRA